MIDSHNIPPELIFVTQCWVDALNSALRQELVPTGFCSYNREHRRTANFTLRKFHTMKNSETSGSLLSDSFWLYLENLTNMLLFFSVVKYLR